MQKLRKLRGYHIFLSLIIILTSAPVSTETISPSFEEVDAIFGPHSKLTDYQKNELWKQYEGKYVVWTGELANISKNWLKGFTVSFRHKSSTSSSDVDVQFSDKHKPILSEIKKGAKVRYRGKLRSFAGEFLPYFLDDGEIYP